MSITPEYMEERATQVLGQLMGLARERTLVERNFSHADMHLQDSTAQRKLRNAHCMAVDAAVSLRDHPDRYTNPEAALAQLEKLYDVVRVADVAWYSALRSNQPVTTANEAYDVLAALRVQAESDRKRRPRPDVGPPQAVVDMPDALRGVITDFLGHRCEPLDVVDWPFADGRRDTLETQNATLFGIGRNNTVGNQAVIVGISFDNKFVLLSYEFVPSNKRNVEHKYRVPGLFKRMGRIDTDEPMYHTPSMCVSHDRVVVFVPTRQFFVFEITKDSGLKFTKIKRVDIGPPLSPGPIAFDAKDRNIVYHADGFITSVPLSDVGVVTTLALIPGPPAPSRLSILQLPVTGDIWVTDTKSTVMRFGSDGTFRSSQQLSGELPLLFSYYNKAGTMFPACATVTGKTIIWDYDMKVQPESHQAATRVPDHTRMKKAARQCADFSGGYFRVIVATLRGRTQMYVYHCHTHVMGSADVGDDDDDVVIDD